MSAYHTFKTNRFGWKVRVAGIAPEIADPLQRFADFTVIVESEMPTPCRQWVGGARFYIDEHTVTTPRRAALILAEIEPPEGVYIKTICKTPDCVNLGHFIW